MPIIKLPRLPAEHAIDYAARLLGGRDILAQHRGVSVTAVGNWKARGIPFEQCVPIEKLTEGIVTRRDLRPDDYLDHWPELADVTGQSASIAA